MAVVVVLVGEFRGGSTQHARSRAYLSSRSRGRDEGNFVSLALIPDLVQLLDALIPLSSSPQHSLLSAPVTLLPGCRRDATRRSRRNIRTREISGNSIAPWLHG